MNGTPRILALATALALTSGCATCDEMSPGVRTAIVAGVASGACALLGGSVDECMRTAWRRCAYARAGTLLNEHKQRLRNHTDWTYLASVDG